MSSVISAALAYFASGFQSRHAMRPESLALTHQLAVYQHSVKRPQLQPADRLFWAWLSRLCFRGLFQSAGTPVIDAASNT